MDSRYASQTSDSSDLNTEEKQQLEALCEELEGTYSNFVSELEQLWEETKEKMETACKSMLSNQQAQLEKLQEAKQQNHQIASQLQRAQEFFQHVSHLIPNKH